MNRRTVALLLLTTPALLGAAAVDPERHVVEPTPIQVFFDFVTPDDELAATAERTILEGWEDSHAVMLLELHRMLSWGPERARILPLLGRATGQDFGEDLDRWWDWIWETDPGTHPDYADFKATLYGLFDERFRDYFDGRPAAEIRLDEVRWGGVGQDGIPPLDHPALVSARKAKYLDDGDIIFAVEINGEARAYPKRILAWHEMVKDTIGGEHFTGVYCTLCGTMIFYRSEAGGVHHELGTSGFLYRSNKLMYDHGTQSLWSTFTGSPAVGPLVGRGIELEYIHIVTTTWGEWRRRHSKTQVLSLDTGYERDYSEGAAYREYFGTDQLMFAVPELDDRLKNKDEILALRFPNDATEQLAISVDFLSQRPVYHEVLGGVEFVVLTDRSGASRVYETGGRRFREWDGESNVHDGAGAVWTLDEGSLTGPDGVVLRRLPAHRAFWFGWYAQYPETRLIRG